MLQSIAHSIKITLYGLLILTAILSISSLFWRTYPLELLSNFRVYYLLFSGAIAIAFLFCHLKGFRVRLTLWCSLGLMAFNSAWIVPWYLPHAQQGTGPTIRVLTFNINIKNDQWDAIATAIRTVKPDVATIIESSVESKEELSKRLTNFLPFVYRTSGGGLTLFSRFPLIEPESKTFGNGTILVASLQINQKVVQLIAAHPFVPLKPNSFKRRNGLLAEMTTYLQEQSPKSLILLGDFNLTPWSFYYSQLVRNTGLHNTRLGFGIEPSWVEATTYAPYPDWVTPLIKIPIDHLFVSQDLRVADCKAIRAANADHRMLWSDLVI
jgi:endonuclease/exonuclease/phosphatase (EEP) superfamily protein YafD